MRQKKTTYYFIGLILAAKNPVLYAQLLIDDISPKPGQTTITLPGNYQSIAGKGQTVAMTSDGQRVYLGGNSGIWRSDDGGVTWQHPEHPQPAIGSVSVSGALLCPNVYDLLVSPANKDIVFAATGRDARTPSKAGIYRSADGGDNWTLVHQFISQSSNGIVGRIVADPNDPNKLYVAGEYAVAKSTDGGITWVETKPQTPAGVSIWSLAIGGQGTQRKLYAIGSRVWYSVDEGLTWTEDPAARSLGISVGSPSPAVGFSARTIAVHPTNPNIVYIITAGTIWRGDFSSITPGDSAHWRQLPSTPTGYPGTTASGNNYIATHIDANRQIYLFASDRQSAHICIGEPTASSDWKRIDGPTVHLDPHGIDMTSDFRFAGTGSGPTGRITMVCDGGAYFSTDGAQTWQQGSGLSTLGLVNATVLSNPGGLPSLCIGMGDNSGYFSKDGGLTWKTQDYVGGDNDACFADPLQPNRFIVFAPRSGDKGVFVYTAGVGEIPDGAVGTSQRVSIAGPPPLTNGSRGWNVVSNFYNLGYRPLIYTLAGQQPRPDGDFVAIRFTDSKAVLVRTTALKSITSTDNWVTTATTETGGATVFQQGPDLPSKAINVVQASGGHESPVYYVGDPDGSNRLWKWTKGLSQWQQLVPGAVVNGEAVPAVARRFFVDPYRPDIVYIVDNTAIRRSDNGGSSWTIDTQLQNALTETGAFPLNVPNDDNPNEALLRDMIFDPSNAGYRFAIGPAGVFYTVDGINWTHFILTAAMPMRPNNATYDPCERALYVSTSNRGLLRLSPLPPDWEGKIGGLYAALGKVTLLRVHDVGTKYGPPNDQLDVEVVIKLDSRVNEVFGFQLRKGPKQSARKGMLDLLRQAFKTNTPVRIDYTRTGCNSGEIIRVMKQ